ncbi:MAG: cysteine hydrolase [Acidovorax sp. SCN 68-22]|nr:MAG: cysteine hydrolase [Acidovorax sp. SCN 68-22]
MSGKLRIGPDARLAPSPTVLVLVDVINPMRFPAAGRLLPHALKAAHAIARLKARLERAGCTAVYANDNYGRWRSNFQELLKGCQQLPGARGAIATLLAPRPQDLTLLKPLHSAFHSTPLEHLLRQMKTQRLVVVGFATDMCVQLTAMDAYMRGFEVWVPRNCTAAEASERKDCALAQMARVFKCSVRAA